MIYFDNAATTKVDPEVLAAMIPFLSNSYGNSNGKYYYLAEESKLAIEKAKEQVSELLNCKPHEIYFNSGATEGNNHILKSIATNQCDHIITTKIEHSSILDTVKHLESQGRRVTYLDVNKSGLIDLDELKRAFTPNTKLVSIGYVNSEIGTIQDLKSICKICKEKNVLLHSDMTQAIGKLPIDLTKLQGLNFVTFSGHKIYGPKGIGVLIVRDDKDGIRQSLSPIIHGGGQEHNYRGGTTATHQVVGIGKACELMNKKLEQSIEHLKKLDNALIRELKKHIPSTIMINNLWSQRVPGIINIEFLGYNNQILLKNAKNIFAASTGSACSNSKPSHVLQEIGLNPTQVSQSIRISMGKYNTLDDINEFIRKVF